MTRRTVSKENIQAAHDQLRGVIRLLERAEKLNDDARIYNAANLLDLLSLALIYDGSPLYRKRMSDRGYALDAQGLVGACCEVVELLHEAMAELGDKTPAATLLARASIITTATSFIFVGRPAQEVAYIVAGVGDQ